MREGAGTEGIRVCVCSGAAGECRACVLPLAQPVYGRWMAAEPQSAIIGCMIRYHSLLRKGEEGKFLRRHSQ